MFATHTNIANPLKCWVSPCFQFTLQVMIPNNTLQEVWEWCRLAGMYVCAHKGLKGSLLWCLVCLPALALMFHTDSIGGLPLWGA